METDRKNIIQFLLGIVIMAMFYPISLYSGIGMVILFGAVKEAIDYYIHKNTPDFIDLLSIILGGMSLLAWYTLLSTINTIHSLISF